MNKKYEQEKQDILSGDNEKDAFLKKIEDAYKIYKISELYFKDVADDYGKQKIARLRMDFARHQLVTLLNEAKQKGIKWGEYDIIKKIL